MAHKITTFESRVVPLPVRDIDTDQIIPARFLKVTDKAGLGELLFSDWRQDPSFVLNQPEAKGAQVLLAGDNFGCGSSREHAPWALCAFGFKAVISTSFADIFKSNALKNGLLPVTVPEDAHRALFSAREADPGFTVTIDLAAQTVSLPDGGTASFPVDSFSKHCLLEGIDELGYLLSFSDRIEAHERAAK